MSIEDNRYVIRRKVLTIFGQQFHVYDGHGKLLGYSKQKAFKLKEDIRFYSDETMAEEKLLIMARQVIDFAAAYDVVDGQTKDMKVPSGAQSGLKLGPPFTIAEGSTVELMLDFDANRSVVVTGPPDNPKKYLLKPRLRLISKDLTGSISATVTNPEHLPTAFAIAGADTVTSTLVDKDSGGFMLAFLPEGLYTVSVRDTLDQFFTSTAVEVIAGRDNALSSITLSK